MRVTTNAAERSVLHHPAHEMHGQPAGGFADAFDFAGVDAGAHRQSERFQGFGGAGSKAHCSGRPVEDRQDPVPVVAEFLAPEPGEQPPHHRVVSADQLCPGSVADLAQVVCALDEISEHHRRQLTRRPRCPPVAGEELLDLVEDLLVVIRNERICVGSPEFDELGLRQVVCQEARVFDPVMTSFGSAHDQGGNLPSGSTERTSIDVTHRYMVWAGPGGMHSRWRNSTFSPVPNIWKATCPKGVRA
ncbi:MAG TPA: hypothetical protein VMS74_11980 [Acidimicrobiia bacterium]|nr:hypothetical protein [Acidimicrobiia bacterium]